MTAASIRTRPVGATTTLARSGRPAIVTATGGRLDVTTHPSEPGFGPLDLLYASLSSCLAISARIAASRLGVLDRLATVEVEVRGEKAADEPSRVARFDVVFRIEGDLDAATRRAIIEAAEGEICTVSNTLRGNPIFRTVEPEDAAGP